MLLYRLLLWANCLTSEYQSPSMRRVITLILQDCYEDHRQFTLVCSRQGLGSSQVLPPGNICSFKDPHKRRQRSPLRVTCPNGVPGRAGSAGTFLCRANRIVWTTAVRLPFHAAKPARPWRVGFSCVSTRPLLHKQLVAASSVLPAFPPLPVEHLAQGRVGSACAVGHLPFMLLAS